MTLCKLILVQEQCQRGGSRADCDGIRGEGAFGPHRHAQHQWPHSGRHGHLCADLFST